MESVAVGLWVETGTRNEVRALNGIAHFLEHMVFKGTARRSARAIAEEIEAVGGHLNAYTAREQTVYHARVLAGDLALAVDVLGDIVQNASLEGEEIERERAVILQEIGQAHDTPDDVVFDHFQAAAFPDQPMGWPVLGRTEVVESMSRPALYDYRALYYRPARMILAAAGQVDHRALVALAEETFPAARRDGEPAPAPEQARYRGGERRDARALEQLHLVIGFDGFAYDDPDYYALSVFTTLFGGGMSSRLFQEVREERGLAYSIYAFTGPYSDSGLFGIYAGTGEVETAELVPVLAEQFGAVAARVEPEEVERARAQLRASVLMSLESSGARCERIGHHLTIFGRVIPLAEIVARIDAVDEAAVCRVAGRLLASRPTVASVGPVGGLEDYAALAARFG